METIEQYPISRYEPSDLDSIRHLNSTHYQGDSLSKKNALFDWVACCNPTSNDGTSYLVIKDGEKVVAYLGRMPADFMIQGKKQKGYFVHDLLVDPEYRKKGLGLAFHNRLHTTCEETAGTLTVELWMTEYTHTFLKRKGHYQLDAHWYMRPVSCYSILNKALKNKPVSRLLAPLGQGLFNLYDYLMLSRNRNGISVSKIDRFEKQFDEFADKTAAAFKLSVIRHSDYLNWQYADRPFANYAIFKAERQNDLTGYVVLLIREIESIRIGLIVDILADPDDSATISSLCNTAIKYFKKEKVESIRCVLTNKNFIRIFKKCLFFRERWRKPVDIMLGNLDDHPAKDEVIDVDGWFLTLGDSDAVLWE